MLPARLLSGLSMFQKGGDVGNAVDRQLRKKKAWPEMPTTLILIVVVASARKRRGHWSCTLHTAVSEVGRSCSAPPDTKSVSLRVNGALVEVAPGAQLNDAWQAELRASGLFRVAYLRLMLRIR